MERKPGKTTAPGARMRIVLQGVIVSLFGAATLVRGSAPPVAEPESKRLPNILIVVVDTLRDDATGPGGRLDRDALPEKPARPGLRLPQDPGIDWKALATHTSVGNLGRSLTPEMGLARTQPVGSLELASRLRDVNEDAQKESLRLLRELGYIE